MSERGVESAFGGARPGRAAATRARGRSPALPETEAAELLVRIRRATGAPGLAWTRAPERIPAGHESEIYAVALREGPSTLADGLEAGGGPLDRLAALPALLRLSWRLPERVAETTRELLALDADPVLAAVRARGLPPEAVGFDRHLAALERDIESHDLEGLREGAAWLRRARPAEPERPAVCHGDLAPNLLFAGDRRAGVVDWSPAFVTVGDPAFEIANTRVMTTVPLPLAPPLRGLAQCYQRALVRRFERALGSAALPSPRRLRYYEGWRRLSTLVGAGVLWRACAAGEPFPDRPNPWFLPGVARAVARRFAEETGVSVGLPPPPAPA